MHSAPGGSPLRQGGSTVSCQGPVGLPRLEGERGWLRTRLFLVPSTDSQSSRSSACMVIWLVPTFIAADVSTDLM